MADIVLNGDTSGAITVAAPAVAGTHTLTLPTETGTIATTSDVSNAVGRNLIINGDMKIDQRYSSSAATVSSGYTVDRWKFQEGGSGGQVVSVQQVTDAPAGFSNSFKLTNTTASSSITADAYNMFWQAVEGLNWSHLEWGTSDAKSVTISFWVKASIAGNYSLAVRSSTNDRSYVTSYAISSANTWEYKTVTIAGPTSGTFNTDNTKAIQVAFTHSMGSNYTSSGNDAWQSESKLGATGTQVALSNTVNSTWQVTGVQLEVGTAATPFEHRPYDMEFARCQRYYQKYLNDSGATGEGFWGTGLQDSTTSFVGGFVFATPMRIKPTAFETSGTATDYRVQIKGNSSVTCSSVPTVTGMTSWGARLVFTTASGLTAGEAGIYRSNTTAAYVAWSAEL